MATIQILGSGSCFPSRLQKNRTTPGYLIQWNTSHLLFECSEAVAKRLEQIGIRPDEITHCAVSHAHPDHFALPQFLQSALCSRLVQPGFSSDNPSQFSILTLFGSKHVIKSIAQLNKIHFEETVTKTTAGLPFPIISTEVLPSKNPIALPEGATLEAQSVYHGFGNVDALAYRVTLPDGKIIAYSGDTGICDGIYTIAQGADVFICEASSEVGNDKKAYEYGHLNPRQAGEIAKKCEVKTLILTHYAGFDSDSKMKKNCRASGFKGKIIIAKDRMKMRV